MLRGRGNVISAALKTTTIATTLTQRRNLEYPNAEYGLASTWNHQEGKGTFGKLVNREYQTSNGQNDALFETGSYTIPALTNENLIDVDQSNRKFASLYRMNPEYLERWPIVEQTADAAQEAATLYSSALEDGRLEIWWDTVFADYPSLRKNLDAAARRDYQNFVRDTLPLTTSAEELEQACAPFFKHLVEDRCIQFGMIWRVQERLMDAMDEIASVPSVRNSFRRVATVHTKALFNSAAISLSYATAVDYSSVLMDDILPYRQAHEAKGFYEHLNRDGTTTPEEAQQTQEQQQ